MTTALATNPPTLQIATTDYPNITCDMSAILADEENIATVATQLQVVGQFARIIKLPDAPILIGTHTVNQMIKGSLLTVNQQCLLIWILTLNSGDVISQQTTIVAPY